ncbi:hypothetical protein M422DRAFT_23521, partial [Sphaerobolus stellatus SS14]
CTRRTRSFVEDIWDENPAIFDSLTVWEFKTRKHVSLSHLRLPVILSQQGWIGRVGFMSTRFLVLQLQKEVLNGLGLNAMTATSLNNGATATNMTKILVVI